MSLTLARNGRDLHAMLASFVVLSCSLTGMASRVCSVLLRRRSCGLRFQDAIVDDVEKCC